MKTAYFAGGCFWCIASAFFGREGINSVTEGYAGGNKEHPAYNEVKAQTTGHRETVCITFDEQIIPFENLVDIFFDNVDPFDAEGQFIDRGFSYTLAIFYTDDSQKAICEQKIKAVEAASGRKVCVSLLPYTNFFTAEEEHLGYAQKHPKEFEEELILSGRKAFFEDKK